jgi:hypothetical protein
MPAVNKHFDAGARRAAIELWRAKVPQRVIMKQLGMFKATLMRVLALARVNLADLIARRKKGSGHPTKLTETTLEIMKIKLQKTPTLTAIQLRMRIPELEGISVRTIQRACKETLNMPSRMMRKKPLLTEQMRIQRLEFANAYRKWDEDDWKQVMFSDESHFELRFGNQSSRCWRPAGSNPFSPKFTKKTVKHPQKVMAWGCFSWMGCGALEFLEKGQMMNGACYRRILDDKLECFMHQHGTSHFLQDGAPCHKSKIVTQWFNEWPNIILIKCPGNSPDLNPIENVWSWMKAKLRNSTNKNMEEWRRKITELWTLRMSDGDSMPKRLAEVIEKDGWTTHY